MLAYCTHDSPSMEGCRSFESDWAYEALLDRAGARFAPITQLTSAFSTSKYLSFEAGPILSISGPLLSVLHTLTRLPVT